MAMADTRKKGKILSRDQEPAPPQGLLGGTVVEGDPVFYDSGNAYYLAGSGDATAGAGFTGLRPAHGIAGRSGVAGEMIPILHGCVMEGRLTGMAVGAPIYLASNSSTNLGEWSTTVSVTGGDDNTAYGYAETPTRAVMQMPNVRTTV